MVNTEYAQKMKRCHDYLEALEDEERKIRVFKRELPLCPELVTQAIEACRMELFGSPTTEYVQREYSEQTTSNDGGPVLEEFILIKRRSSADDEGEEVSREIDMNEKTGDRRKSNWLRSVQLWNNQTPNPPSNKNAAEHGGVGVEEVRKNGGAFQPFTKEKTDTILILGKPISSLPAGSATSSSTENDTKSKEKTLKRTVKNLHRNRGGTGHQNCTTDSLKPLSSLVAPMDSKPAEICTKSCSIADSEPGKLSFAEVGCRGWENCRCYD